MMYMGRYIRYMNMCRDTENRRLALLCLSFRRPLPDLTRPVSLSVVSRGYHQVEKQDTLTCTENRINK